MRAIHKQFVVKRFLEESGYTNTTNHYGIRKDKRGHLYDYNPPKTLLNDFLRWLKKEEEK